MLQIRFIQCFLGEFSRECSWNGVAYSADFMDFFQMLHPGRFFVLFGFLGFVLFSSALAQTDEKKTVVVKGKQAGGPFTEERPASMCFKEVKVSREGSQRVKFEITMAGPLPTGVDLESAYFFCFDFDVDNKASTGYVGVKSPNYGGDMSFYVSKGKKDALFVAYSTSMPVQGRARTFTLSGLKVRGDTIEVSARSEVFRMFDSCKFFISAIMWKYEKGRRVSETTVDQTSIRKL